MDRRSLLKGFGSMVSWSRGIQSRLFRPPFGDDPGFTAENASAGAGLPASSEPAMGVGGGARDIRRLTQHFTGETEDISPWMFVPQENIRSLSTSEHPGFVTVWHGDKGKDIKGILKEPIKIDDYPRPWEFHLGVAQYRSSELPAQSNYAIGLNITVTFSDPSTWPKDRTEPPPDTHSFQLFVVHLRVPQIKSGPLNYGDPTSEVYLVYGRGDLDPTAVGNWNVPYIWQGPAGGSWSKNGGPASYALSFRVKLASPTSLEVGFFGGLTGAPHVGWRMKTIDVSRFGKITGIWEIGPIVSLDRWIPDVLAPELGLSPSPPIKTSDPSWMYYTVDYAAFFGTNIENLDHMSDDFDVPGFQAKWYHESQGLVEDYSHPGYLTITLPGPSLDGWAMCPTCIGSTIVDLRKVKDFPGYEFEIGFVPPEDNSMWDLYMSSVTLWDEAGKPVGNGMPYADPGAWQPGVQYFPKERRHRFINMFTGPLETKKNPNINIEFEPEVPESVLRHRPLYMLAQILDSSHLRVGFRRSKTEPWLLSKVFDTTTTFGKIGRFNPHTCFTTSVARQGEKGWGVGNYPRYPQILIDYVRYGYGLSTSNPLIASAQRT